MTDDIIQLLPTPKALTVKDPWATFARDLSPRTQRAYSLDLREFFSFLGVEPRNHGALREVRPPHVLEYLDSVSRRDELGRLANAATVARKLSSVRAAFNWLRNCGLCEANPAQFVRAPRVSATSPKQGLSREEARALVDAVEGKNVKAARDRAILLTMLYGGLRRSELVALRIRDLYQERQHWALYVRGKGEKVRTIPLAGEAVKAIHVYIEKAKRMTAGLDEPLFLPTRNNRTGELQKHLTTESVYALVGRYVKSAGFEKHISPHSLRHTAITFALDGGAKLERVQSFAGHSDPKTTIRYFRTAEDLDNSAAYSIKF